MMMKYVLLLVVIVVPMVQSDEHCDGTFSAAIVTALGGEPNNWECLDCESQIKVLITENDDVGNLDCLECEHGAMVIDGVIARGEDSMSPVENILSCLDCSNQIVQVIEDNYNEDNLDCLKCEQAAMVIDAVLDNDNLKCLNCTQVKQIIHQNYKCLKNTCFLYGRTYDNDGYGSSNGGNGFHYGYDEDELWNEYNSVYQNYDGMAGYGSNNGFYDQYGMCNFQTIADHVKFMPGKCSFLEDAMRECEWYGTAPVHIPGTIKSYETEYKQAKEDYDACRKEHHEYTTRHPQIEYDDSTTTTTESTTDNNVETVGWVLVAVGGAMLLASIAFFMAGRSERKAAAQNRIAGHGVMA